MLGTAWCGIHAGEEARSARPSRQAWNSIRCLSVEELSVLRPLGTIRPALMIGLAVAIPWCCCWGSVALSSVLRTSPGACASMACLDDDASTHEQSGHDDGTGCGDSRASDRDHCDTEPGSPCQDRGPCRCRAVKEFRALQGDDLSVPSRVGSYPLVSCAQVMSLPGGRMHARPIGPGRASNAPPTLLRLRCALLL